MKLWPTANSAPVLFVSKTRIRIFALGAVLGEQGVVDAEVRCMIIAAEGSQVRIRDSSEQQATMMFRPVEVQPLICDSRVHPDPDILPLSTTMSSEMADSIERLILGSMMTRVYILDAERQQAQSLIPCPRTNSSTGQPCDLRAG